ncbi:MAG: hypothetical protein JWM33_1228, partial [Caulobacteraceae bacterium]|nr:hypothetical protein [Caulobacteraceae bacterium]
TALIVAAVSAVAGGLEPFSAGAANLAPAKPAGASFGQMLLKGVDEVNQKLVEADSLVQTFALDGSIPPHQVTFALEQARLSVELMMQVRSRLVEGYQELMRMQL